MEDPDAVGEASRLVEVVRRQQDRRVVLVAQIPNEGLDLALAADIQTGRRLVEQQKHRRGQERSRDRDLLLHPARQLLERLSQTLLVDAETRQHRNDLRARLVRPDAVQPRRVDEVLHRRQLLEERGLDGDTVDEPLDRELVAPDVQTEDADLAGVRGQERREDADQRRLARPVGAEQAVDLAPLDAERYVVDGEQVRSASGLEPRGPESLADARGRERGDTARGVLSHRWSFASVDGHLSHLRQTKDRGL